MKIIQLVLIPFLVSNFSKIQKISDLNSIGVFRWDAEVTKNQETMKDILNILKNMTAEKYLNEVSNKTVFMLNGIQDQKISNILNTLFKGATELEKSRLKKKIAEGRVEYFGIPAVVIGAGIYCGYIFQKRLFLKKIMKLFFEKKNKKI